MPCWMINSIQWRRDAVKLVCYFAHFLYNFTSFSEIISPLLNDSPLELKATHSGSALHMKASNSIHHYSQGKVVISQIYLLVNGIDFGIKLLTWSIFILMWHRVRVKYKNDVKCRIAVFIRLLPVPYFNLLYSLKHSFSNIYRPSQGYILSNLHFSS